MRFSSASLSGLAALTTSVQSWPADRPASQQIRSYETMLERSGEQGQQQKRRGGKKASFFFFFFFFFLSLALTETFTTLFTLASFFCCAANGVELSLDASALSSLFSANKSAGSDSEKLACCWCQR